MRAEPASAPALLGGDEGPPGRPRERLAGVVAEEAVAVDHVLRHEEVVELVERVDRPVLDARLPRQHTRDVGVVDPQERRMEIGVVELRRQVRRDDEGAAGAVRRVGLLWPLVLRDTPLGAAFASQDGHSPPHGAHDRVGGTLVARGQPLAVHVEVVHQAEHVDDHVVVALEDPLRLLAVLRDPLQGRHPLRKRVQMFTSQHDSG